MLAGTEAETHFQDCLLNTDVSRTSAPHLIVGASICCGAWTSGTDVKIHAVTHVGMSYRSLKLAYTGANDKDGQRFDPRLVADHRPLLHVSLTIDNNQCINLRLLTLRHSCVETCRKERTVESCSLGPPPEASCMQQAVGLI